MREGSSFESFLASLTEAVGRGLREAYGVKVLLSDYQVPFHHLPPVFWADIGLKPGLWVRSHS